MEDTGFGMTDQGIKNLFTDYSKLEDLESRNKSGTGLGLSICKSIIEKMGGSITVKSKKNKGTIFIINMSAQFDDSNSHYDFHFG